MRILCLLIIILFALVHAELLQYCSGPVNRVWNQSNFLFGQRMTPSVADGTITNAELYLSGSGSPPVDTVIISLWDYEDWQPQKMFYEQQFQLEAEMGWHSFPINQTWSNHGTEFLIAVQLPQSIPGRTTYFFSDAISTESFRNWMMDRDSGQWWDLDSDDGDFFFRVYFEPCPPTVEPTTLSRVKSIYH